MREIKFRAWDLATKEMFTIDSISWNDMGEIDFISIKKGKEERTEFGVDNE